jgi:GNAT superfamily N-acetyltransferase
LIKFRQPDRGGDNVPEAMRPASDTVLPAAPIVAVQATEREGTNLPKTDLNRPCPKRAISAEVDPKPTLADELVRTGSGANNHDYHLSATGARVNVYLERNSVRKRELQQHLTAMLPEWFGKADSNAKYALQAESLDGYLAESEGVGGGLLLLKQASHRSGIGRALIATACEASRKRGVKYLFVATLHPSVSYEPYQRTRRFYEAMGFVYVLEEQFPADPESPLAYYLKQM